MKTEERTQVRPANTQAARVLLPHNTRIRIEYDTLTNLVYQVWEYLLDCEAQGAATRIELPGKHLLVWNPFYAHVCFAKGRISVEHFVELIGGEGYEQSV
ncbi:MAG: hypothetical protein LBQ39_10800 [Tannerellaceae bacterium]|jgi:hypothetical protein|nr:hypothetical protein [Tannerellaceae bacterium]